MDARLRWTERSRELLARCGIFDLYRSRRAAPDGREGDFHVLEAPDWVTVVPIVHDRGRQRCFLMVRQHRHGADLVTTEFPAGLVEPGEDPLAAHHEAVEAPLFAPDLPEDGHAAEGEHAYTGPMGVFNQVVGIMLASNGVARWWRY